MKKLDGIQIQMLIVFFKLMSKEGIWQNHLLRLVCYVIIVYYI